MSPLRRRMIDDMQIRNLTPNTQRVYVAQVVRFACYFRKLPGPVNSPPKADPNRHLRPDETATLLPEALSLGRGRSAADG